MIQKIRRWLLARLAPTIVIEQRSHDWHACFDGNRCIWAAGKTPDEAVADLIKHHPEWTGIQIIYPTTINEHLPSRDYA